jgi:hypothetical protein
MRTPRPNCCSLGRLWPSVFVVVATYWSVGCLARIDVFPQVSISPEQTDVLGRAKLEYEGNPDYLPRTVANASIADSKLTIRYNYNEEQRRSEILYVPSGTKQALSKVSEVTGQLEILHRTKIIRAYKAVAVLSGRNEFTDETLSQMRRRGLLAVRANIEAQMYRDKDFLLGLSLKVYD